MIIYCCNDIYYLFDYNEEESFLPDKTKLVLSPLRSNHQNNIEI